MSTIINNPTPNPTERTTVVETDSSGGWAVTVVILLAIIAGGLYYWFNYRQAPAEAPAEPGTTINVTLPGGESKDSTNQ
jgi:uncharacterized protein HemX